MQRLYRRGHAVLALAVLGLAVLACPATAEAEEAAEVTPEGEARAKRHYQRGKAAFELGNFPEALAEYEQAYHSAPLPGFLFNIGQCHRNLNNYKKAIFSFRLYLRKKPNAGNRDAVQTLIDELDQKLEAERRANRHKKIPIYVPESRPITDPPPVPRTPVYQRWWFWTVIGAAVAGGAAGIYFAAKPKGADVPASALGVWNISR